MALPKIVTPEFETTLPSNNQTIKFRPFLVKEEKILLMASEGQDQKEIMGAVLKILQSCIETEGVIITELPLFDIEWLFLQVRGKSVGEVIPLKIKHVQDEKCKAENDIEVKIDDIKIEKDPNHKNVIDIDGNIGLTMGYPTLTSVGQNLGSMKTEDMFEVIEKCVVNIFDKEQVYTDFTKAELQEFLGKFDKKQFDKIVKYFQTFPKLRHKIKYKCVKCGADVEHTLESLMDFFL